MIHNDNCTKSNSKEASLHNDEAQSRCLTREEVLMLEAT
jgi:hypothetical protein